MNEEIKNLREALKFSPDNVPLKLHLAEMLTKVSNHVEAEREYKEVLHLQQNNLKAKAGLAKAFFHNEKFSAAVVLLEEILTTQPDNPDALLLISNCLYREDAYAQAAEYYRKLLQLYPEMADPQLDNAFRNPSLNYLEEFDGSDEVDEDALGNLHRPKIKFEDVGGMADVKREIELKIIKPLQHPEIYKAYGKKMGGGILLYGPPGCGKTHLARATAGEVEAAFMSIGINDILDMWIGNSEKNLHEVFETARANKPCVLFFDEVDALGASRSDMRQSAGRHLINQFLSELDGVQDDNDGLLIIGATNAPWHLDPAFRRPGRFDRIIFVAPPDEESRREILKIQMQEKPAEKIDFDLLAKKTEGFSGADIMAAIDIAIEAKLQDSFLKGSASPLSTQDIINAVKKHRPSTKEWFSSAKNYALFANDSGLYDDVLKYLKLKK